MAPPNVSNSIPTPTRVGARYEVIEQLGRGGMAVVYRVRDKSRSGDVALKQLIVDPESSQGREVTALFEREFYTLAQLSHPSVIEVHDYGVGSVGPYYTMELLDGGDLGEHAPLPYRALCDLMVQVCSSLSLLHSRRLVHRDISPRNVRCTRQGVAKLIDFGAMVPMGPSTHSVGTPAFIAPEVLHQLSLDARTDLFSLGATLYFAVTGRTPFAARSFADLREAWRQEPLPMAQLVPDVPPALDALVRSLLRIDPAQRPRSAFEVMQRLCAVAGIQRVEASNLSQAYLSTPTLVARDPEQQRFRQRMRRAIQGRGGGLSIEGRTGFGRSRLLDACVLDAKTLGATVLRVAGSAATSKPFASAHRLVEQLLDALPATALERARESQILDTLFMPQEAAPTLLALSELHLDRHVLQAAFNAWIRAVCRTETLLIAVDDVEGVDEASLALLAALAHAATDAHLMLLISVQSPVTHGALPALDVLRSHCAISELAALRKDEIETLFTSVFGNVPNVGLVSDRIYHIAAGNPRDSMALAQHMLDKQLIEYTDGSWILPAQLTVTDLPADAEEALRARVAMLPPLARRLAEAHALALPGAWSRADYAVIADSDEAGRVDDALTTLLRQGVLSSNGRVYTLAHQGFRAGLVAQMSDAQLAERHLALAGLRAQRDSFGLAEVHHLLLATAHVKALDRFAELLREVSDRTDFAEASGMNGKDIAATFEQAYEAAVFSGRPAREIHELARHLNMLSVVTDNKLHRRYGPGWFSQLERDSGLLDYRACDANLAPAARLQEAVQRVMARYAATPEIERVYRFDEAIKYLARYMTLCLPIGSRSRNMRLLGSLPAMLEPFAIVSPVLHALWQNAISGTEMNYLGMAERARERALAVYEQLGQCSGEELRYVDLIRNAIAYAVGSLEFGMGYPSVMHWIGILEQDPLQHVNAMYLRRLQCIMDGDGDGAERCRKQAEVLSVQASARQMFMPPLRQELVVQVRSGDLAGLKHVVDQIAAVAVEEPGWISQVHLSQGYYQRLRGDLPAAKRAFERCFETAHPDLIDPPPCLNTWLTASAGYVGVLVDMGAVEAGRAIGLRALERSQELGLDAAAFDLIRELALAEAKLGDHASACRRIEALIEKRAGMLESHRAIDYEIRARIAIEAKDPIAAARYTQLATQQFGSSRGAAVLARHGRLMEVARRAGIEIEMPVTGFESSVLGPAQHPERRAALTKITSLFQETSEPATRAQRAIEALCATAHAASGVLYVAEDSSVVRVASHASPPDPRLDAFVEGYWLEQLDDVAMTTAPTEQAPLAGALEAGTWTHDDGTVYRLMLLKSIVGGTLVYAGLAAVVSDPFGGLPPSAWDLAAAICIRLVELGDAQGVLPG
jgi:ABC-type transporter Mla MlaB component